MRRCFVPRRIWRETHKYRGSSGGYQYLYTLSEKTAGELKWGTCESCEHETPVGSGLCGVEIHHPDAPFIQDARVKRG